MTVSAKTTENLKLCQRYFDDMLERAKSANQDLEHAGRKLSEAQAAWEREFFAPVDVTSSNSNE